MQAAHEILCDPQQKAKYDADRARQEEVARAKQEKAARDVLNALRRNAAPSTTPRFAPPPNTRRATTGARGTAFSTAAGRGRPPPPPPPPPPSSGADKYAAFTRAGAHQPDRAEQEAQKAKLDAMRGFRSMRNGQPPPFPPPPPLRPSVHPTAPRPDITPPSTATPPRHQRSYEHFQNETQPGFPGMSRAQSARKPAGFAPTSRIGDEPMAQSTSAYGNYSQERRDSYFPNDDTPRSPNMARHEPGTSPLKHSQSSNGLGGAPRRPHRPELERLSTRYAQSSGEKTDVNGVGRSNSAKNSPVERDWGGHEDYDLRRPHSHHASTARHQSASPNLRHATAAEAVSSSESESSTDDEPENFASRPKAKPRTRRQKAGTGAFAFRHVVADDPNLHSQLPPPNHKHVHSPQDEYTARYVYPPPPPRSDPQTFPESHTSHSNGTPRMNDPRQGNPNMYGTFHSPSRTWSEDWGFSPSKLRKSGPFLNGLPSWAVPSSVFPQQKSSVQKEPLKTITEEEVVQAKDWFSHADPRFNQKLLSKADHVSCTSFTGVHQSGHHPYPQPGYQSVSQENINTTFSAADWDGKFNSGDEHFRPTEGREGKSPSRTSRTRARSVGRGSMLSPNKEDRKSETIDLTSDNDAPNPPRAYQQKDDHHPRNSTTSAFQPGSFSAKEWAAKLKDQTWAVPNSELNGSNPKTPKRPSRSTGARRPTLSTKMESNPVRGVNSAIPPESVSETVVPGLSDFDPVVNGARRASIGGFPDAMDIDDSLSDNVPIVPPTNNETHTLDQSAPRNKPPPNSDVNLNNLAKVAPFAPSSSGLKDMDDLSTALPFESRAAPAVNLNKPTSSSDLRLPKPPKPINPPAQVDVLGWERYVAEMNAYFYDWGVFNKKMIEHFRGRQEQVDMSMASHWISMTWDGRSPAELSLDGSKAGYATFMAWLQEDAKCREWWNVANERNRQCFEDLGKTRARMKAVFESAPS